MTPRILIVDDEKMNQVTLEAFLTTDGYELHYAENGREAFEKARALMPDLILLDVMLPELDGFGVCKLLRSDPALGRIPIILITALHDEQSRLEGLRAGADDFLTKPCIREELRARVRTVVSLNRFRALAEERTRFERLYELAPAGIVLTDEQGRVLAANRRAETWLGGAERPLVGDLITTRFEAAAAAGLESIIAAALRDEEVEAQPLHRGTGADERIMLVRGAAVPEGRRTSRAMLVLGDVTAEVRAREALEKLNAELEDIVRARTRQLEDANSLLLSYASFVSHDLRSPLTVVKGYLALLEEGVAPISDEAKPMVTAAHRAANTMAEMVTNILQLAQDVHDSTRGPAFALDPQPVLKHLISHVRDLAENRETKITLAGPLPTVGVTAVLLERVFFNLLTNAVKYSAGRSHPVIEIGAREHPEGPVLYVRDNGVGFDARDADRLFQEFSRLPTAGASEGLGLGLSLVNRLVRAHGGRIWAESDVGAGATFFVLLPAPTPEATALLTPAP